MESNPRLELMRLARKPLLHRATFARVPGRDGSRRAEPGSAVAPRDARVWPAGVEPAISGAQNRRGGHLPYSQRTRTRPWRRPGSRRPWNRTTLHRRIRAALAQPARRRCRGVARESHPAPRIHSPRARYKPCDAVSPGGVEPPSSTVGTWCSSTERRREDALDGNRTRLTRETAGPHVPDASESTCSVQIGICSRRFRSHQDP